MAVETVLADLEKEQTVDNAQILNSLLNPENIDMKTHIMSPITFAMLEAVVNNLQNLLLKIKTQKIKLPITKKLLEDMIRQLKKLLVSWNRLGRIEITKTLQSLRQEGMQERSFYQKLLGIGKD